LIRLWLFVRQFTRFCPLMLIYAIQNILLIGVSYAEFVLSTVS